VKKKQIGVALSGGVDSTACALQLMKHHEVHGFFMRLAGHDLNEQEQKARAIADQLGITFQVIDLSREFTQSILHYFTATYQQGRTPNPCVVCNQTIKFGLLLDAVLARGMEAMATGHYARITRDGEVWQLRKGRDTTKDQSYFLARLNQRQLSRCLFPLGEQKKNGIYQIVEDQGITGLRGQESQDICFLSSTTLGDFLKERIPLAEQNGEIITDSGQILGRHHGLFHYTIGQRRGLGLSDTTPWYVTRLDAKSNSVIVGKEEELYCGSLLIHYPHWLVAQAPKENQKYQVKIRYRHQAVDAQIKMINEQRWRIKFDTPQRAVTPGQFAVIYEDDQVLGCGEIEP
jgi:tRNA-specific 2-thiouridylase